MRPLPRWMPAGVSLALVVAAVALAGRTPSAPVSLAPIRASVHVTAPAVTALEAETTVPLFAPSRTIETVAETAEPAAPAAPPPVLTGVVQNGGKAVALVRGADGAVLLAHIGDSIDGWLLTAIAQRSATFTRGGEKQTVELVFGAPRAAADAAPPPG